MMRGSALSMSPDDFAVVHVARCLAPLLKDLLMSTISPRADIGGAGNPSPNFKTVKQNL